MPTPSPASIMSGGATLIKPSSVDRAALYCAAVTMTIGSALTFAAVFLARGGLDGTALQVASMFALSILPIWASVIAIEHCSKTAAQFALSAQIAIFASILWPVAGLYAGPYTTIAAAFLGLFGIISGRGHLRQAFKSAKLPIISAALMIGLFLIVFTETIRFFLPESLLLGIAIPDRYYHVSIAQMIANFGRVSLGADGLIYRQYHFLSHLIAAGFAKSSGADVPLAYLYWGAFTLKIHLVWAAFVSGLFFIRTRDGLASATISRLAYASLIVIIVGMLESESFLLGTTLFFAALPLMVSLATKEYPSAAVFPALLTAICGTIIVTIAKVSAGFFCVIGLFVILWHMRRRTAVVITILASAAIIAFITVKWIAEQDLATTRSPFLMFWLDYLHYFTWTTFFSYLIPLALVGLMAGRMQIAIRREQGLVLSLSAAEGTALTGSGNRSIRILQKLAHADGITQILLLSVLGSLLVLFTTPLGANNSFFSLMLLNLSLLLLPAALSYFWRSVLSQKSIALILAITVTFCIVWKTAAFVFTETIGMPYTLVALYRAALPDYKASFVKDSVVSSLRTTRKPFSNLQSLIDASPIAQTRTDIIRRADAVGGHLVVQIPPEADEVWHKLSLTTWWCMTGHMVVPAAAGIAEIRSIPPKAIEEQCVAPGVLAGYGFASEQDAHRTADFTADQLCTLARPLAARRVYRLMSYKNLNQNRVIDCP